MTKTMTMAAAFLALSAFALPATAFAHQHQAKSDATEPAPKMDITIDDLGNGFYRLAGPGGNIGVSIGVDGIFVIDDKFDRFADQIIAQLRTLSDAPIRYVINTHYHGDHTGANGAMKDAGAVIVAHDNVRARMGMTFQNTLWDREVEATDPHQWPVLTFSDTATFHINGQTVQVMHTPAAHTDGDSIVYFKEANVLHMGDNFFHEWFPYVDIDAGGSLQGMIASHDTALAMIDEDTQVIPGHGNMATKQDLQNTRDMLVDILARVKKAAEAGQSVDDMIDAKILSDYSAFDVFIKQDDMIRITYRSYKGD